MEFVPTAAMATLVVAIINFLRYARAKDVNGMTTQASSWIAGVAVTFLGSQTDFADGISIGEATLGSLNAWSLVLVGMTVASVGSFAVEIKKAIDNSDSASKPPLAPPSN